MLVSIRRVRLVLFFGFLIVFFFMLIIPQYADSRDIVIIALNKRAKKIQELVSDKIRDNEEILKDDFEKVRGGLIWEGASIDFLYVSKMGVIFMTDMTYKVVLVYEPIIKNNKVTGWIRTVNNE